MRITALATLLVLASAAAAPTPAPAQAVLADADPSSAQRGTSCYFYCPDILHGEAGAVPLVATHAGSCQYRDPESDSSAAVCQYGVTTGALETGAAGCPAQLTPQCLGAEAGRRGSARGSNRDMLKHYLDAFAERALAPEQRHAHRHGSRRWGVFLDAE
ncbi:hypothetical protein Q5752_000925 [Cryptotrichosporon argae]